MIVLLAILFCGYFVLGGLDYGVALVANGRAELDRIAPFFLGNEVWLVAAIGLLFGAFPTDEGLLLGAYRVPVALALIGVVVVTATFGLRLFRTPQDPGRIPQDPGRIRDSAQILGQDPYINPDPAGIMGAGALEGVAKIGGALAALGWGATLGAIWHGGDFSLSPAVIGGALGMLAIVGVHGWAFLRRRWAILAATTAVMVGSVAAVGSTVTWHPASSAALELLTPVAYALVPLLVVLQAITWRVLPGTRRMFRGRQSSEPRSVSRTGSA
jgi:cytochrome d ubiquinol oxidase subunit II